MTISSRLARRVVTNNGSVTEIDVTFPAELAIYVKVYAGDPLLGTLDILSIGTDYTLTGVGPSTSSFIVNILHPTDWAVDTHPKFAVFVDYPVDQQSDVGLGGVFGARFEAALDRCMTALQSMDDKVKRSIKIPLTSTVDTEQGISLTPNTVLAVDENGYVVNMSPAVFASLILAPESLAELLFLTLNTLPVFPSGDTTGYATNTWGISGGYLVQVQP